MPNLTEQLAYQAAQLAATANAIGGQSPLTIAINAINAAFGQEAAPPSSIYDKDGLTVPDETGCVRIKAIDDFIISLRQSLTNVTMLNDVLKAIGYRYACVPGLSRLDKTDTRYWMIATEISWADMSGWLPGPEQTTVNKYQLLDVNASLPAQRIKRLANEYVDGGLSLGHKFITVDDVVSEIKSIADRVLSDWGTIQPNGVDFSPLPPRK